MQLTDEQWSVVEPLIPIRKTTTTASSMVAAKDSGIQRWVAARRAPARRHQPEGEYAQAAQRSRNRGEACAESRVRQLVNAARATRPAWTA